MGYIAGIGAANVDIRGRSERKLIMGDSNPGTLYTTLGGVCRNICENLARLGSNVKLVTVVGDDENGRSILRGCEAAGMAGANYYYVVFNLHISTIPGPHFRWLP